MSRVVQHQGHLRVPGLLALLRAAEDIFNQIYIALIYTRDNRSIPAPTYAIYTTVRLLIIFLAFIFNRNISPLDTRNDGTDNDFCGIYLITCCGNGRILIIHIFISRDLIIGIRLDRRDIDITSGKYGSVLIHIVHLLLQEYLKILYFGYTSHFFSKRRCNIDSRNTIQTDKTQSICFYSINIRIIIQSGVF